MTRQQLRQVRRERLKQGEIALKTGLSDSPTSSDLLAVATLLAATLANDKDHKRASAAVKLAHRIQAASAKARPGQRTLACRHGCAHCCHNWVGATAPEVFLLADTLRSNAAAAMAVHARAAQTANQTPAQRFGAKLPCPVLGPEGACTAYESRPSVCRQVTSFDVAPCLDEFEGRDFDGEIKVSRIHLAHARNSALALAAALAAHNQTSIRYELSAALRRALEDDKLERRWLDGEDVFAGIETAPPDDAPTVDTIAKLAQVLKV